MAAGLTVEHLVSAGGVVYRYQGDGWEVVLGRQQGTWRLPKGTPNPGEALTDTAHREVEEETGLKVKVGEKIGLIRYYFVWEGARYHKTVYFFLMEAVGGSVGGHDSEFDQVEWLPVAEACRRLTFTNEVRIVRRAARLMASARNPRLATLMKG